MMEKLIDMDESYHHPVAHIMPALDCYARECDNKPIYFVPETESMYAHLCCEEHKPTK